MNLSSAVSEAHSPFDDIVESLRVANIQTPFDRIVGFQVEDQSVSAAALMRERRYDFAPVFDGVELLGRVRLERLTATVGGNVGRALEPLAGSYMTTAHSTIPEAMRWLEDDPWLLVLDGRRISGLVTPSDLNRQAARAYFYLLLVDFEIRLAEAIRDIFPDQEIALDLLSALARRQVGRRIAKSGQGDVESDAVSAMSLRDLIDIGSAASSVQDKLDHILASDWEWARTKLIQFRHEIMHPTKQLLDDRNGLGNLIEFEETLSRLAGLAKDSERP